jgi:UDP-3-O-[3-hydroxymyristoyl] glucosamine N-acyltransferase
MGQHPGLHGCEDAEASTVVDFHDAAPGTLSWLREGDARDWDGSILVTDGMTEFIGRQPTSRRSAVIVCDNPRLAFMKIVTAFFEHQVHQGCIPNIHPTADIHRTAVIGASGQGYEWDGAAGCYIAMPHIAGVVIGQDVVVGPQSTVMRGVLRDTRIGRGTKIGNGVNIGHSVSVGEHCLIVAHASLGGSARIGNHVTIYQGAMIERRVRIGDDAVVGMGAVVLSDIPQGETWVGVPARKLR